MPLARTRLNTANEACEALRGGVCGLWRACGGANRNERVCIWGNGALVKVGASRVPECGLVGSELRALVLQVSHEDDLLLLWRWAALNAALRRCLCADPLE